MTPPEKPPSSPGVDFTEPVAEPNTTPEAEAQARLEAETGSPQLLKVGFYLSMNRRMRGRRTPSRGDRYAILVVEDDADLAQLVIDIFMTAGFEVRWAANRAEINAELHRAGIDLVLLDIVLPDADGLQVLRRVREHPRLADLPVIMMTGKVAPEDVLAGLAAGADGYVTKPFKMSGLVNAVNVVLGIN
ncbi:MAG: response regulator [Lysobacter sp.]|nr:response regulator [Lysobacter sp.]